MEQTVTTQQNREAAGNYLRTHRKKAGLSQRELASLLGYVGEGSVARHERSRTMPPLIVAVGYEVIFRTPISQLFSGVQLTAEQVIETRLMEFEQKLQQMTGKGARGTQIAQKLMWLNERRDTR